MCWCGLNQFGQLHANLCNPNQVVLPSDQLNKNSSRSVSCILHCTVHHSNAPSSLHAAAAAAAAPTIKRFFGAAVTNSFMALLMSYHHAGWSESAGAAAQLNVPEVCIAHHPFPGLYYTPLFADVIYTLDPAYVCQQHPGFAQACNMLGCSVLLPTQCISFALLAQWGANDRGLIAAMYMCVLLLMHLHRPFMHCLATWSACTGYLSNVSNSIRLFVTARLEQS